MFFLHRFFLKDMKVEETNREVNGDQQQGVGGKKE
jgi:hypothetical protein